MAEALPLDDVLLPGQGSMHVANHLLALGPRLWSHLTEPSFLLQADKGIPLVHYIQQLPQDLVLRLTIGLCLQGFWREKRRLREQGPRQGA